MPFLPILNTIDVCIRIDTCVLLKSKISFPKIRSDSNYSGYCLADNAHGPFLEDIYRTACRGNVFEPGKRSVGSMCKKTLAPPDCLGTTVKLVTRLGSYLGRYGDLFPGHQLIGGTVTRSYNFYVKDSRSRADFLSANLWVKGRPIQLRKRNGNRVNNQANPF